LNKAEQDRLTRGCTGVKRTTGQHPGGIIIIPSGYNVYHFTPIQRPADAAGSDVITTHFDFHSLHDTILKLDILGHDDPTIIKMLEDITGIPAAGIKMNDPKIMSLFLNTEALGVTPEEIGSKVGTYGLPEFGTRLVRQKLVETKPKAFSDLIQISGLSHGRGVWEKKAQDLVSSGVCTVSEVIGTRDSIMVYLMYKGIEPATAFKIMESVRKGKGLNSESEQIMADSGVPAWYISSCKKIKYMFPKAHAAAYVLMAYRQAWYKINKPEAYYAAYFTVRADDFDAEVMTRGATVAKAAINALYEKGNALSPREKSILTILELVFEMYARDIDFLPVDIYTSEVKRFLIEGDRLRPPLTSLKGLGEAAAQSIVTARQDGRFISIEDFAGRSKASKTVVEILRGYGCFNGMAESSQLSFF
jgi:DNA polymerase-3 subunit alpha (Gram-positive type)